MLYYKALDEIEEGIYILDANLTIKFINKVGEKILGVKREDVIDRNSDECFGYPPNDVRLVERTIEECKEFISEILPYKWGKYEKFMQVKTKLLKENGEIIGALAIFTEITDYVRLLPEDFLERVIQKSKSVCKSNLIN